MLNWKQTAPVSARERKVLDAALAILRAEHDIARLRSENPDYTPDMGAAVQDKFTAMRALHEATTELDQARRGGNPEESRPPEYNLTTRNAAQDILRWLEAGQMNAAEVRALIARAKRLAEYVLEGRP